MSLLALSRAAIALTELAKEAEPAPALPATMPNANEDVAHGTQGRLLRPAVGGLGLKKVQGPRAYGPRLKIPGS